MMAARLRPPLLLVMIAMPFVAACNTSDLTSCGPIAPSQLPSGSAPGDAIEGVAGGTKQWTWGDGADRVDLLLESGLDDDGRAIQETTVRGHDASVFQAMPPGQTALGVVWSEGGCSYTFVLDATRDVNDLVAFAEKY